MCKYLLILLCFLSVSVFAGSFTVTETFSAGPWYYSSGGERVSCNFSKGYEYYSAGAEFEVTSCEVSSSRDITLSRYEIVDEYGDVNVYLTLPFSGDNWDSEMKCTITITWTIKTCPDTSKCEKWKCPSCNKDFCSKHQQHFAEGGTIASNCVKDHFVCADTQAEALSKWDAYKQQNYVFCSDCKTYYCVLCPHKCDGECDLECTKKNCPVCGITYCPTHDGEPIITICPDCKQQKCNHQTHTCPDPDPENPNPENPNPENPNPENPNPENPNPENPNPENPNPENPNPENPNPENPNPENPNPENPNPVPDPPSDYTDILDALNGINDKLNEQNKKIDEIKEDVSDILESLTKSGTYSTPDGLEEQKIGDLPDNTESDKPFGIGDGQGLTDGLKDVGGLGNIDSFSPSSGGDWIITFPLSLVGFGLEDVTFNVTQNLTDLYSPLRSVFSVIVWLWGTYMGYGILRDGLTLAG